MTTDKPRDAEQDEQLTHQERQIGALLEGQHQLAKQMAEIVLAHQEIVRRHNEDLIRVARIERTISETALALVGVKEVLGTVAALKGGLRVLGWLGSAAKWLASIGAAVVLVLAVLKYLLLNGSIPPPK